MLRAHVFQSVERQIISFACAAALMLVAGAAAVHADAQQPPDSPPVVHLPGSHAPASGAPESSPDVYLPGSSGTLSGASDPAARREAAKLAELTGIRQKIGQNFATSMHNGAEEMRRHYPNIDARFVAEWEKRMRAQFNPSDYVAVFVNVYADHFTGDELEQMIQALRARQNSKSVVVSPQLAEKIRANAVAVQSELIGGFSEVGARKGGEIGIEIGKEHPEWVKGMEPAGKK